MSQRLQELLGHELVKGVAIGACAAGKRWQDASTEARYSVAAHAHIAPGKHQGWICIRWLRFYNLTTVRHEVAHLILGTDLHNERWRRVVRELGGRVERAYQKRAR